MRRSRWRISRRSSGFRATWRRACAPCKNGCAASTSSSKSATRAYAESGGVGRREALPSTTGWCWSSDACARAHRWVNDGAGRHRCRCRRSTRSWRCWRGSTTGSSCTTKRTWPTPTCSRYAHGRGVHTPGARPAALRQTGGSRLPSTRTLGRTHVRARTDGRADGRAQRVRDALRQHCDVPEPLFTNAADGKHLGPLLELAKRMPAPGAHGPGPRAFVVVLRADASCSGPPTHCGAGRDRVCPREATRPERLGG